MSESNDSKKCVRCGRVFVPDAGFEYQKICGPCWSLTLDKDARKVGGKQGAGIDVLLERALLLKRCWGLTDYAKDEEAREALAVTLFLTEVKK